MAAIFDRYVAVDWSAASVPSRGGDSIWVASRDAGPSLDVMLTNPPTRAAAMAALTAIVEHARDERVLIGVDVPFGFPSGTAAALGLHGAPWRATWDLVTQLVHDDDRNRNDRFEVAATLNARFAATGVPAGPFWGVTGRHVPDGLTATRPVHAVGPNYWRHCEGALRAAGRRPFPVWQVAYAGSVGGQMLTALPRFAAFLRDEPRVHVWPFTTGLGLSHDELAPDAVVLAEVWPSAFAFDRARHLVKDAAQVLHTVDELAAADACGELARWAAPVLDVERLGAVVDEEGWVLAPLDVG